MREENIRSGHDASPRTLPPPPSHSLLTMSTPHPHQSFDEAVKIMKSRGFFNEELFLLMSDDARNRFIRTHASLGIPVPEGLFYAPSRKPVPPPPPKVQETPKAPRGPPPKCLNPKCDQHHLVRECPITSTADKKALLHRWRQTTAAMHALNGR